MPPSATTSRRLGPNGDRLQRRTAPRRLFEPLRQDVRAIPPRHQGVVDVLRGAVDRHVERRLHGRRPGSASSVNIRIRPCVEIIAARAVFIAEQNRGVSTTRACDGAPGVGGSGGSVAEVALEPGEPTLGRVAAYGTALATLPPLLPPPPHAVTTSARLGTPSNEIIRRASTVKSPTTNTKTIITSLGTRRARKLIARPIARRITVCGAFLFASREARLRCLQRKARTGVRTPGGL